jgi:hypothetical protein
MKYSLILILLLVLIGAGVTALWTRGFRRRGKYVYVPPKRQQRNVTATEEMTTGAIVIAIIVGGLMAIGLA